MKLPRFSIVKLMVIVGIVALNLAAARMLFLRNSEMLIGVAPIGLALQVGISRLMRSRGRVRAFWVGLVGCGLTTMMAFAWVLLIPGVVLVTKTGAYIKEDEPPMYGALYEYQDVVTERVTYPLLGSLHIDPTSSRDSRGIHASFVGIKAVAWLLPQLFIALVVGMLTGLIFGRRGKMPVRDPRLPASSLPSVVRS